MASPNWTREELILALNLYLKLSFGKMHSRTPEVIHLANLIGRTANAVAMRLSNYASVDPYHQQRGVIGLTGGIKQVKPIWDEFIYNREELLFESEKILAAREKVTIEYKFDDMLNDLKTLQGEDKIRAVKTRVNQTIFRQIVITNYTGKCAISKIDIPDLLVASHIIPWSKNEKERLNPENGICLSPLYDKAFDKGYIGINTKLEVMVSQHLKQNEKADYYQKYFSHLQGFKIDNASKYAPRKEFLEYHSDEIFKR